MLISWYVFQMQPCVRRISCSLCLWICLVFSTPPSSFSLNSSHRSLSFTLPAFLLNRSSSTGQRREAEKLPALLFHPHRRSQVWCFLRLWGASPSLSDRQTRCRCRESLIILQLWPDQALSCPSARRRGIRQGRRHVGTEDRGPPHWSLLL